MQDIYNCLEVEFQPLKLKDNDKNEELVSLEEYEEALRDITLIPGRRKTFVTVFKGRVQ